MPKHYTAAFKAQLVLELLSGTKSMNELCRQHQLKYDTLARWKAHFLAHAADVFATAPLGQAEQAHIAELERTLGRLTLELEIAKKASSLLSARPPRSER
jgi:transposase-like protein